MNQIVAYIEALGFPDTHFYGNDSGGGFIAFGSTYSGSAPEGTAQAEALAYTVNNGYPNAALYPAPPTIATKIELNV